MYRFLWRPKWVLSHLLILALIVSMILLSMWQLRRLDEKRTLNDLISDRADGIPMQLADVLADKSIDAVGDGDKVEYQAVGVRGVYLTDREFTVPNRTLNGAPGRWVVTPLQWAPDQPALLVLRGFIPQAIDDNDAPIDTVEPPSGEVTVRGWLRHTETPEGIQSKKADLGDNRFARIDIERIELARSEQYVPVFLLLGAQDPPTASEAIGYFPLPERSEGAHFSYAIQWAIFTLIAAVGYPLTLRKVAKGKLAEGEGEGEGHGDGDSTDAAAEVPADVAAAT